LGKFKDFGGYIILADMLSFQGTFQEYFMLAMQESFGFHLFFTETNFFKVCFSSGHSGCKPVVSKITTKLGFLGAFTL